MDGKHGEVVGIIGLGYVGLPLALAFASRHHTVGYDRDGGRVAALRQGVDKTGEVGPEDLRSAERLTVSDDPAALARCHVFIVAVPTPIDAAKRPDLQPLVSASEVVGAALRPGALVVYESTVYPGATEEVCVPILERCSGLVCNRDFVVGYSPERVNPGDRKQRLADIRKVTSGSTPAAAEWVDRLYAGVIRAGTYRAPSIRVAEAAKVIENTQRDVNIALVNELAMLFERMGLDTGQVLDAAATKWNFLPFRPGLVGGHCIGVDPYYLTHKAQTLGFHPEMILAGRRINDGMGAYVAARVVKLMASKGIGAVGARALVLGVTFKENCPDVRNTRVVDLVSELASFGVEVDVVDPLADPVAVRAEHGIACYAAPPARDYAAVVLAVAHDAFRAQSLPELRALCQTPHVWFDVKGAWPADSVDGRL